MTILSVHLAPELDGRVAEIAAALDRPKAWVIEQAVKGYVELQDWQRGAIQDGMKAADAGRVASHEDVETWVRSWNEPHEQPAPKCG